MARLGTRGTIIEPDKNAEALAGATGLASTLSVMEIAHRHYWAREENPTTSSSNIASFVC